MGFVDVVALLVVDGFMGFAGGQWLVIAGFVGSVLRERERDIERERERQFCKEERTKNQIIIIIIITVLQTVWSLFKCCGLYSY